MPTAHLSFLCELCGYDDFYLIPYEEITESGDKVRSSTLFKMVCEKCHQEYEVEMTIKRI